MARLNPTNFGEQNFYSALLTADITSGSLTISLDTVPTPTSGILVIDPDSTTNREIILYTSKGASTITCPSDGRGFDSTTAVAHLTGSTVIMAPVKRIFDALASGELSTDPMRTEFFFDHVNSGAVWSGDSYGSTRAASMTSGVAYILGRRITLAAVAARTFTASRDTYIDITDAGDGTATITYTEVANNAASPALATNALRIGIIVTGASSIAAVGSVNQGQEDKILPIASSVPYAVTDSLGNLICNRNPLQILLGARQITTTFSTTATTPTQVTGLSMPILVPTARKVDIGVDFEAFYRSTTGPIYLKIWDGAIGGTQLHQVQVNTNTGQIVIPGGIHRPITLSAGLHTINISIENATAGTASLEAASGLPAVVSARLV